MYKSVIKVVAAVIEREGKILVGQRKRGDSHGLKWEFPGGKVEQGELPKAALARELEEELGIQATIGPELIRYEHRYPGRTAILLIFFQVTDFLGEPGNFAFERILWEAPEALPQYDFLEGDRDFVRRLAIREFLSNGSEGAQTHDEPGA
ncbi:MAG TPA: (deoxy)nucleoside triphosphate pyrophosphohydrolase [Bryobacteraceae bacterium]|nr:(deoxy)nucleoside triphosphate pyrophosphohydrolase [Bryobacteraceae bacterium]